MVKIAFTSKNLELTNEIQGEIKPLSEYIIDYHSASTCFNHVKLKLHHPKISSPASQDTDRSSLC